MIEPSVEVVSPLRCVLKSEWGVGAQCVQRGWISESNTALRERWISQADVAGYVEIDVHTDVG